MRDFGANSKPSSTLELRSLEKGTFQANDKKINLEGILFIPPYQITNPVNSDRQEGSYAFKWIRTRRYKNGPLEPQAVIPEGGLKSALADELQDFPVHFNAGEIYFDGTFEYIVQAWDRLESIIADVGWEECALERFAVAEEFVAELHELAVEVGAVDVLARAAVGDEFADVLGEAAAEVEEGLVGVAEAGDEGGIVGGEVDGQVEEEVLSDAGVGVDVPGFIALSG